MSKQTENTVLIQPFSYVGVAGIEKNNAELMRLQEGDTDLSDTDAEERESNLQDENIALCKAVGKIPKDFVFDRDTMDLQFSPGLKQLRVVQSNHDHIAEVDELQQMLAQLRAG